jgi:hypothetical protein
LHMLLCLMLSTWGLLRGGSCRGREEGLVQRGENLEEKGGPLIRLLQPELQVFNTLP